MNCIFCNISEGKAAADFVFKDGDVFAIRDMHPAAPTHILIIPRKHVVSLAEIDRTADVNLTSFIRRQTDEVAAGAMMR
jgi:histidine triad (HIT) family protein